MKSHSVVALFAIVSTAHAADVESESQYPTCQSLNITDDTECKGYCGEIGYDGTTESEYGSTYWIDGTTETCKCKTSPPGEEFDVFDYELVCFTPLIQKDSVQYNKEGSDFENKNTYSSGSSASCFCDEVEIACDRLDIECNSGSMIANAVTITFIATGMGAIAFAGLL